jgi:hypothetical protein
MSKKGKAALATVITLLGFGAAIWNTVSVERKSADLQEAEGVLGGLEGELEAGRMNFRLAVEEYEFSTLHAANAYEIDTDVKLLAASVAPGETVLRDEDAPAGEALAAEGAPKPLRDRIRRRSTQLKARLARRRGPKAEGRRRATRKGLLARLSDPGGKPKGKLGTAIHGAGKKVREAIPSPGAGERRQHLMTIRAFQLENLSRWRQYMHQAVRGEPMSQEEVDEWEGVLQDAFIEKSGEAIGKYSEKCADCIATWDEKEADSRVEIEEVAVHKAELKKQVSRGKSIYMGLMLVGLVLVTIKDLGGKGED